MVFHKVFLWFIPLGFYGGWTLGGFGLRFQVQFSGL